MLTPCAQAVLRLPENGSEVRKLPAAVRDTLQVVRAF